MNVRIVTPRRDKMHGWENVNPAGGVTYHRTTENALRQARRELRATGGGEVILKGDNGRVRQKEAIEGVRRAPGRAGVHPITNYLQARHVIAHDSERLGTTKLNGTLWRDPTIQKVIRNCQFSGSDSGLVFVEARNVLVYGCTFDGLRTGTPGDGCHGIAANGVSDEVIVAGCLFREISADGIQWGGGASRASGRWLVQYSDFIGPGNTARYGENGLDVKGVIGPIRIDSNIVRGYRPCEEGQDCSGSLGVGIVIHDGSGSGATGNLQIAGNLIEDNFYAGLNIAEGAAIDVQPGNVFRSNGKYHLLVGPRVTSVRVSRQQTYGRGAVELGPATTY